MWLTMRALRTRVVAPALLALACQVVLLGTPMAESILASLQDEDAATECICGKAGHHHRGICPMHGRPAQKPPGDGSDCRLSSPPAAPSGLVLPLAALPEPPLVLAVPAHRHLLLADDITSPLSRSAALDPPPPRI
jgi:hypothetical protein